MAIACFYIAYGASSYLFQLENAPPNYALACPYYGGYGIAPCPKWATIVLLVSGMLGSIVTIAVAVAWIRVPERNGKAEETAV